jgi:uncharacterized membrane protein YeaQ/YmgE (transglycosylase-associated protein family)
VPLVLVLVLVVLLLVVGWVVVGLVFKLLWWVLVGILIGALARALLPGRQRLGILATALAGIAGALLGGILANAFDVGRILEFVLAVIAAMVVVALLDRRGSGLRV